MSVDNRFKVLDARVKELQEEVRNHKRLLCELRQKYHYLCVSVNQEVLIDDY